MNINPKSISAGVWLVAVAAIAILTTGLLPVVIFAVLFGVLLYGVYALGIRLHDRITGRATPKTKEKPVFPHEEEEDVEQR